VSKIPLVMVLDVVFRCQRDLPAQASS